MCGTTSISLRHFVLARIVALPQLGLYVTIGASMGSLTQEKGEKESGNQPMVVGGMLVSFLMVASVTRYMKKELNQILEKQKREKHVKKYKESGEMEEGMATVEVVKSGAAARHRKH